MTSIMFLKPIVNKEIIKIIYKFNQNKSAGHDNIWNVIIKQIAKEILVTLTLIFNTEISTGIVPDELKIAKNLFQYYHVSQKFLEDWFSTAVWTI